MKHIMIIIIMLKSEYMTEINIKSELERLETERQATLSEQGFVEFYKIPEGESVLEFLDVSPRINETYPDRVIFRVKKDTQEYDLSIGTKNPMYRDILLFLNQNKRNLKILRLGTKKEDTRYKVSEA